LLVSGHGRCPEDNQMGYCLRYCREGRGGPEDK
jgi:hypothetical protein